MASLTEKKRSELRELEEEWRDCEACPRRKQRRAFLRANGSGAQMLFVIDRPSNADVKYGRVGRGDEYDILDTALECAGLTRRDIVMTPGIACGTSFSDKIAEAHRKKCAPRVLNQVHIVQPKIIVCLGAGAVKAIFPKNPPRHAPNIGRVLEADIPGDFCHYKVPVLITYSLSGLMRTPDMSPTGTWAKFAGHIIQAMDTINLFNRARNNECVRDLMRESSSQS